MNKDAVYVALRIAEDATNFDDLRHSLIIICNELLNDNIENMNQYMNTYFRNVLDIKKIFNWATEYGDRFEVRSAFGEYLIVRKDTGLIIEDGYSSVVKDWWNRGFLEQY